MFEDFTFTSPATGLPFKIIDDDNQSYIVHAITGDKIPLLYDPETDMLMIPSWAFKHFEMITPDEAAKITGFSRQYICSMARKGQIKSIKTGKRSMLVSKEDVIDYAEGN